MITRIPRVCGVGLALAASLSAQTPAPSRTPAAAPSSSESDVVALPEFSVSTSSTSEYVSAESITGTRVATKIRDLPFTVNTVTADFLDDFAAFEFRDQFGYTSSVSVWETLSTGYSLRGFDADVQLRNGFRRIGLIDKVNVERAEIIKGPAASIYGTVLPGGTINVITKKPKTKPAQRISVSAGGNNLLRAQASSTGPVGDSDRFFYRVDVAADQSDYDQPFKQRETRTIATQLQWKPAPATSLLFEVEWLKRNEIGISSATVPFRVQTGTPDPYRTTANRTYTRYVAVAEEVFNFNSQGEDNFSDRYVYNTTLTFEHRISDHLSLRSGANWFERSLERQEVGGRDQFNPITRTVQRGTPRLRPFPEGGLSWQTDLLATWETGKVQHKTLLTVDYQRQTEKPERWDMTNFTLGMPAEVQSGLRVDTPNYDFVTLRENRSLYALTQKENNSIDLYGVFLSERMIFLDGRANVMAGARYDYVDNHSKDLVAGANSERQTDEISYQVGANYRVFPRLTTFANFSRSFVPQFRIGRNLDGSTFELPNEFGKGWEVGVKSGFFDDRLTFTAAYYDIQRENVARDTTDPLTGVGITVLSGIEASKGYEFDFNWVVTPELQFFGGYGYNDTEVVSNAQAPHLQGSPLRRSPKDNLGVGAKWERKNGSLKGVYVTAGYKYYGRSIANPSTGRNVSRASVTTANPFVNRPMPNGLLPFPQFAANAVLTSIPSDVRVDDGRESIFNDAYDVVEAGLGYKWRTGGRRYSHKIQVNASNLFDIRYTYGSTGQGPGLNYVFTYDLSF
ncbi:MAG TPA: TonB-dependent receptor [Opitutaceae bacterium]|nr:TonB-dependent receptor [Opitutaceae bacterium]HRE08032.1 TonB-dependent receptor [Opitutaceae bacterium]